MDITEVRVKLVDRSGERLRAFCSVTLDGDFVVRDLKVIGGSNGAFVAMPSRKLADRCSRCGCKNHLRARFCNECGGKLNENRAPKDAQGRAKLHADVAHPINAACRERIQQAVIEAYEAELERAKSPDYQPADYDEYEDYSEEEEPVEVGARSPAQSEDEDSDGSEAFGDYNSLIADLKREAADRQPERGGRGRRGDGDRRRSEPEEESSGGRGRGRRRGRGRGRYDREESDQPPIAEKSEQESAEDSTSAPPVEEATDEAPEREPDFADKRPKSPPEPVRSGAGARSETGHEDDQEDGAFGAGLD